MHNTNSSRLKDVLTELDEVTVSLISEVEVYRQMINDHECQIKRNLRLLEAWEVYRALD